MQTETAFVHVPCAIAVGIANDDRIRIITAVRHVESDVGHACDAVDVQQLALQPCTATGISTAWKSTSVCVSCQQT